MMKYNISITTSRVVRTKNLFCNQNKEGNIFYRGKRQRKKYGKGYKETDMRNGGTEISVVKRRCGEYAL